MTFNNSHDFANKERFVDEIFATAVAANPITSQLLTIDLSNQFDNTKMEWMDDTTTPLSWTLGTDYIAAAGIMLTADTTNLVEGMIVQFDKVSGARSTLIAQVGAIVANTSFVITVYGGSVDENLLATASILLLDNPSVEGSDAQNGNGFEPVMNFNHSQIFDEYITLTDTARNSKMYGINKTDGEIMDYLLSKKLQQLAYKFGATSINMPRVAGTATTPGTMGGWLRYLKNTIGVNKVDGLGATVTAEKLNELFAQLRAKGTFSSTLVAHPSQAKNLSALNTSGNNPVITRDDTTAGSYVSNFVTDFGDRAVIVYSYDMDKDKIALIDPSLIKLRAFAGDQLRRLVATTPGSRTLNERITGQFSLEVKNVKEAHGYIENLAI